MKLTLAILAFFLCSSLAPGFAKNDFHVPGREHVFERGGQKLYLWERCLPKVESEVESTGKLVLFLHGATISGRPNFDLELRDLSTMQAFAREGWDTFCLDVQGFGKSDDPVEGNWSDTESAVLDLKSAVDFVRKLRGVRKVSLVGWSWGCQVAGVFAERYPKDVGRLVLYGSRWKALDQAPPAPKQPFRSNNEAGAASDFVPGCFEEDVVEAYVRAAMAADPVSPNGPLVDFFSRLPLLTPARIAAPTMIIMGEYEAVHKMEDQLSFFAALKNTDKRFVVIPGGGHAICLEKPRDRWRSAVLEFLQL